MIYRLHIMNSRFQSYCSKSIITIYDCFFFLIYIDFPAFLIRNSQKQKSFLLIRNSTFK